MAEARGAGKGLRACVASKSNTVLFIACQKRNPLSLKVSLCENEKMNTGRSLAVEAGTVVSL